MKSIYQIIVTVILVVIIGVGAFFGMKQLRDKSNGKTRQAVFLSNGQVYFGYVTCENCRTIKIKDIYYLQVQESLQPPKDDKQQPQVSLVKLGNELHGPKDVMRLNRDQVLFIEDMKDDSKVNDAIADYKKNGDKTPAAPVGATP